MSSVRFLLELLRLRQIEGNNFQRFRPTSDDTLSGGSAVPFLHPGEQKLESGAAGRWMSERSGHRCTGHGTGDCRSAERWRREGRHSGDADGRVYGGVYGGGWVYMRVYPPACETDTAHRYFHQRTNQC